MSFQEFSDPARAQNQNFAEYEFGQSDSKGLKGLGNGEFAENESGGKLRSGSGVVQSQVDSESESSSAKKQEIAMRRFTGGSLFLKNNFAEPSPLPAIYSTRRESL